MKALEARVYIQILDRTGTAKDLSLLFDDELEASNVYSSLRWSSDAGYVALFVLGTEWRMIREHGQAFGHDRHNFTPTFDHSGPEDDQDRTFEEIIKFLQKLRLQKRLHSEPDHVCSCHCGCSVELFQGLDQGFICALCWEDCYP